MLRELAFSPQMFGGFPQSIIILLLYYIFKYWSLFVLQFNPDLITEITDKQDKNTYFSRYHKAKRGLDRVLVPRASPGKWHRNNPAQTLHCFCSKRFSLATALSLSCWPNSNSTKCTDPQGICTHTHTDRVIHIHTLSILSVMGFSCMLGNLSWKHEVTKECCITPAI